MACCSSLGKCILISINVLFLVVALALIAGGIILAFVPSVVIEPIYKEVKKAAEASGDNSFPPSAKDLKNIPLAYNVGIALLAFGIFLLLVSAFGCVGACCTNCCRWMLLVFSTIMVLLMIAEIVVGTLFYITNSPLHSAIKSELKQHIKSDYKYNSNDSFSTAINLINKHFQCCGVDNSTDFPSGPPRSCDSQYLDTGCYKKLTDLISENIIWAGLVLGGILLFQLIEVIFAYVVFEGDNKVRPI